MQAFPSVRILLKFAILYCIYICVFSYDADAGISTNRKTTVKNYINSSVISAPDVYCRSINTISPVGNSLLAGFKTMYPGTGEPGTPKQLDNKLKFSLYIFYSGNLLTRLQKKDMIYPFHYFW